MKALYGEASRLTVMNAALDRIEAVLDEPELSDNGQAAYSGSGTAGTAGSPVQRCYICLSG